MTTINRTFTLNTIGFGAPASRAPTGASPTPAFATATLRYARQAQPPISASRATPANAVRMNGNVAGPSFNAPASARGVAGAPVQRPGSLGTPHSSPFVSGFVPTLRYVPNAIQARDTYTIANLNQPNARNPINAPIINRNYPTAIDPFRPPQRSNDPAQAYINASLRNQNPQQSYERAMLDNYNPAETYTRAVLTQYSPADTYTRAVLANDPAQSYIQAIFGRR
jgi:hypothetical protein